MLLKTRGIVFRCLKYGETSVIADIFTEEKGLHSFIAGSVRTARSKMPYSLFQPMTMLDTVAYFRDDPDALNRLKEARADLIFTRIPFDIKRGAVALFMAEVCRKSIHEAEENRDLFAFLSDQLIWLDASPHPIANLHLHFLAHLCGYLGFQPVLDDEMAGGELFFDLKEGLFGHVPPLHGVFMEPEATGHLLALLDAPVELCHEVALATAARKELLRHLLKFYSLHVPGFGEINTPGILEMVF